MEDDRHRAFEETVIGGEPSPDPEVASFDRSSDDRPGSDFADDAESNRSDDTALDDEQQAIDSAGGVALNQDGLDEQSGQEFDESDSADQSVAELAVADEEAEADRKPEQSPKTLAKPAKPAPAKKKPPEPEEEIHMDWYILKVQSNRERSIAEALGRKMRIEGLERYFDQVIVPTEKVTEFKGGKKKVVERKLYPGYIVVHMHINDDTWFAVRETSGVGDFTGSGGKPTPMLAHEVARIIQTEEEETSEAPKLDIKFSSGDKVKVKEGNFENFEGEVNSIDEASGRVIVMINIFGRSTPVELEYWQIEAV
jgi:transcriptional antiterminator NusG